MKMSEIKLKPCPFCGAKMDGGVKRNEQSGFNQHTAEMV